MVGLASLSESRSIGFPARSFAELKVGFAMLKAYDEGLDGGFQLRRCGPTLRIEHDRLKTGSSHSQYFQFSMWRCSTFNLRPCCRARILSCFGNSGLVWLLLHNEQTASNRPDRIHLKHEISLREVADFAQVAALPLIVGPDDIAKVLLLTSRDTKRWVIPKGWPMRGRKPHEAAAREALEEGGVSGHFWKRPIGAYSYFKRRERHFDLCHVDVYMMRVEKQHATWAEKGQREAAWFTLEEAAELVEEQGLVALLVGLARADRDRGVQRQGARRKSEATRRPRWRRIAEDDHSSAIALG
jgi:8-oxo-dGTP pyrophosphatase MutT (NUDIX family)